MPHKRFDLSQIKALPLSERISMTQIDEVVIDPDSTPPDAGENRQLINTYADRIRKARDKGASVMLTYGAHLIRNGMGPTIIRMMEEGWITHVATNGAGTIHDWEYSWHRRSTESVRDNTPAGKFGTWQETGLNINLAVTAGASQDMGYGESIGKFIYEDGVDLPSCEELLKQIKDDPANPLTAARADLFNLMQRAEISGGRYSIEHQWKQYSVPANAYRLGIPFTVHPGIGYDIISNHPAFNPAAIGRGGGIDFQVFADSVTNLTDGVYLSVGSAIMSPQVFEKCMSCANNVLLQKGRSIQGHSILIVDLQDGGNWDWSEGEPPKTNAGYYLRFCKSFARMNGQMDYLCADNRLAVHNIYHALKNS